MWSWLIGGAQEAKEEGGCDAEVTIVKHRSELGHGLKGVRAETAFKVSLPGR